MDLHHNWSDRKFPKWLMELLTLTVVFMTATIAFCSSIHTAAIPAIAKDLSCSSTVATLGVTTFLLGFGTGPLIFAPLSEIYGRNPVYRSTLLLFVLFNIGCALSPNTAALLVFRFLCGFFGSPTGKLLCMNGCEKFLLTDSNQLWWFFDRLVAIDSSICSSCTVHCS